MKIDLNPPLEQLRAELVARVNVEADTKRAQFITVSPGQIITYLEKEREAREILSKSKSKTPHLSDEAKLRGLSEQAMAELIVSKAEQWRVISAKIEIMRQTHILAIESAATVRDALAAAKANWAEIQA